MTYRLIAVCACAVASIVGGVAWAQDERPFQFREPEKFWQGKTVFQKRGIVIEDDDYIIRERYWVLARAVTGEVVAVERGDANDVFVSVRFDGMGGGWQQCGVNIRDRVVTQTKRHVTVRPDSYGDGGTIEEDEVSFAYRIEGDEVEPGRCGLIIDRAGDANIVRYPAHLVALVSPRKGETVIRSWDWHGGRMDGGRKSDGRHEDSTARDCIGTVIRERDEHGFIDVQWLKTKRKTSHRFDHFGFYDLEVVAD